MTVLSPLRFGVDAREMLAGAADPRITGALAVLESFYYSLNNRDIDVLRRVWADDPLAQLNNPVGGIIRGGGEIVALYERIFAAPGRLQVVFDDFVQYADGGHALFAGRETVTYGPHDAPPRVARVRTSRYFRFFEEQDTWRQLHHHGSIDDPDALGSYQEALLR
jgi:limonene-1,2-epoxide hydrolase